MRMTFVAILALMIGAQSLVAQQQTPPATQPATSADDIAALELRANQLFASGEYALALPMLKELAVRVREDRQRVEPLLEKVRVAETQVAQGNRGPNAPRIVPRTPHPSPVAGEVREMSLKELGNFDYDDHNGGNIPADVKRLSGSIVRIRGFMLPMDQATRITRFAVVPDLFSCCFGQPPQIHHTLLVTTPKGKAVRYFPDEIVVEGRLVVEEKKDVDGFILSVFEMEAHSVTPAGN